MTPKNSSCTHITDGSSSRSEFINASLFERQKYEKYLKVLSDKLNKIHKLNKPDNFWESVIGFTLWLHIANCRRIFKYAENNKHNFNKISTQKFIIPSDQADSRKIFKVSDLGDQLLLQNYNMLFNKSH